MLVRAAAAILKGCTTEFLVERCAKVEAGWPVLVHAAAGGVGLLLVHVLTRDSLSIERRWLLALGGLGFFLWRKLKQRFAGVGVLEYYASTEASAVLANASGEKIGAVGRPLPAGEP